MSGKTLKEAAAEKLSDTITVQGIAVEGVTPDTLNDFGFLEAIAVMSDPDADDGEKLRAIANLGPVIFGAKQWRRIKAELREKNDGRLPAEAVMGFIDGILTELNAKNS